MRISDWSSDVCSSDLRAGDQVVFDGDHHHLAEPVDHVAPGVIHLGEPGDEGHHGADLDLAPGGEPATDAQRRGDAERSEEHTSELQSLMRISYAVFCLKKKKNKTSSHQHKNQNTPQRK